MRNLFTLSLLLLTATAEAAIPLKAAPTGGSVSFLAVGRPSMLKIHGKAPAPTAKLSLDGLKLLGTAEFEMDKLGTGISLRDQHMKEKYLKVKENPKATLTLTDAPVDAAFATSLTNSGEKAFKGKLKLNGQEKEVQGTYQAKAGLVQAKFPIKLNDFGIEIPSYLGVTVAENVDVQVELPLQKE